MFASTLGGRPLTMAQQVDTSKFALRYDGLSVKTTYHLSLFILPDVQFDPGFTALIYYQYQVYGPSNQASSNPPLLASTDFKLLGSLNSQKQSAIFKINPGDLGYKTANLQVTQEGDMDMDVDTGTAGTTNQPTASIILGISVEPTQSANQIIQQQQQPLAGNGKSLVVGKINNSSSQAALQVSKDLTQSQVLEFSNKIIANAYNFLSSFADGNNKVSMDKFNDWWNKFKSRMANDPGYLKRLCNAED